jgi:hypothetical protein
MRLWSFHPKYLDTKGLVALWREALLAQAVLSGKTRGYRHHPQLQRFREADEPGKFIAEYLKVVHAEAARRGYRFDATKIGRGGRLKRKTVTTGQLRYEWAHLRRKLKGRAPDWLKTLRGIDMPEPHPLFRVVDGGISDWEVGAR